MKKVVKRFLEVLLLIMIIIIMTIAKTEAVFTAADRPYDIKFTQVECSDFSTIALDKDGNIWTWGSNTSGQLGDGTTVNKLVPTQITSNGNFTYVTMGDATAAAIDKNGNIWAWGDNTCGTVGNTKVAPSTDSIIDNVKTPVQVTSGTKFKKVISRGDTMVALDENGNIWGWGSNMNGLLLNSAQGNWYKGTKYCQTYPIQITSGKKYIEIDLTWKNMAAIDSTNNLWVVGYSDSNGMLGSDSDSYSSSVKDPDGNQIYILLGKYEFVQVGSGVKYTKVSLGGGYGLVLDDSNNLYGWGKFGWPTTINGSVSSNEKIKYTPEIIANNITSISCGTYHIAYKRSTNTYVIAR